MAFHFPAPEKAAIVVAIQKIYKREMPLCVFLRKCYYISNHSRFEILVGRYGHPAVLPLAARAEVLINGNGTRRSPSVH
jgi:hypothetical protein